MMSGWLWSLTPMYWVAAGVFKRNYTFRYRAVSGDDGPNTAHRGAGVRTTNMSVESPEEHQPTVQPSSGTLPGTYQVPYGGHKAVNDAGAA